LCDANCFFLPQKLPPPPPPTSLPAPLSSARRNPRLRLSLPTPRKTPEIVFGFRNVSLVWAIAKAVCGDWGRPLPSCAATVSRCLLKSRPRRHKLLAAKARTPAAQRAWIRSTLFRCPPNAYRGANRAPPVWVFRPLFRVASLSFLSCKRQRRHPLRTLSFPSSPCLLPSLPCRPSSPSCPSCPPPQGSCLLAAVPAAFPVSAAPPKSWEARRPRTRAGLVSEKKRVILECTVWANSALVLYVGYFLLMTSGRHRGA
jgi:hypothetical protein